MIRNFLLLTIVTIGLIFGEVAMAIEEPAFERLEKVDNIEIRQYRPVIVAETFVDGDMSSASNNGFRQIADYIFGNNRSVRGSVSTSSEKIAMTAPVSVEPAERSEKIVMNAPVSVEPQGNSAGGVMHSKRWRVQFSMPSEYSMATLPKPRNPAVTLREVPGKRYAVLVFSGLAGEKKVQQKTDELLAWLKAKNRRAIAAPQLARYNPPWTLPFLRRNEILVEVAMP
ncbi:MAG: heme-binding protein [bacterium]|nr:heme-binding protein [bacterium]